MKIRIYAAPAVKGLKQMIGMNVFLQIKSVVYYSIYMI